MHSNPASCSNTTFSHSVCLGFDLALSPLSHSLFFFFSRVKRTRLLVNDTVDAQDCRRYPCESTRLFFDVANWGWALSILCLLTQAWPAVDLCIPVVVVCAVRAWTFATMAGCRSCATALIQSLCLMSGLSATLVFFCRMDMSSSSIPLLSLVTASGENGWRGGDGVCVLFTRQNK